MKNKNLWAPWRYEYLKTLSYDQPADSASCFFCDYWNHPEKDQENLVLWRTPKSLVLLNRFPYTGGHLLIAPADHVADLQQLEPATLLELMLLIRDAQKTLTETIQPHGFNIGININRCAGAGLPDHIHIHIVPRWDGDTNLLSVCSDIRVISQSLQELHQNLRETSQKLNLPAASTPRDETENK